LVVCSAQARCLTKLPGRKEKIKNSTIAREGERCFSLLKDFSPNEGGEEKLKLEQAGRGKRAANLCWFVVGRRVQGEALTVTIP